MTRFGALPHPPDLSTIAALDDAAVTWFASRLLRGRRSTGAMDVSLDALVAT
jgi:hypothetical protein